MRDTSIPITVRQMKSTAFIVFLFLSANSMAEDQSNDSWLDEVDSIYAEQSSTPPWETVDQKASSEDPFAEFDETAADPEPANPYQKYTGNRFEKYAEDQGGGFVIPPLSPAMKASRKKEETITHYYNSIRPGAKLPDDVYECVLKNMRGIGSNVAATMVWQACLRLNLK